MIQPVEDFLILPRHLMQFILRLNIAPGIHEVSDLVYVYAYLPKLVVQVLDRIAESEHLYFRGFQQLQKKFRFAENAFNALFLECGELFFGKTNG